jgi:hypothetical protein
MNNKNIISNKFDLNWPKTFSYKEVNGTVILTPLVFCVFHFGPKKFSARTQWDGTIIEILLTKMASLGILTNVFRGCIFIRMQPFYEQTVSDLDP